MVVESRARFQDPVEIVEDVFSAGEAAPVVISGFAGIFPVAGSVLSVNADGWVHPAARRNAAMNIQTSSTVCTDDDMINLVGMIRK
jgi:hypothetical protein